MILCEYIIWCLCLVMLAVLAAGIYYLASRMLKAQHDTLFELTSYHSLNGLTSRLFSRETVFAFKMYQSGDQAQCVAALEIYFKRVQEYIRSIDICNATITRDKNLEYFIDSVEGFNVSDYLAFRLQLNKHFNEAKTIVQTECKAAQFGFSAFHDLEAGVGYALGEAAPRLLPYRMGGRGQYLCIVLDVSQHENTIIEIFNYMLEQVHKKTMIRVLAVGYDIHVLTDYVEMSEFSSYMIEYRSQSEPISDEAIFYLLLSEYERFQIRQNAFYTKDGWISRVPKLCAVFVSAGLATTGSHHFGTINIPVSVLIPNIYNATKQEKELYTNLLNFIYIHNLNVVSYRKTVSELLDSSLRAHSDANRMYRFYCPNDAYSIAPYYFQYSDSVAESMQNYQQIAAEASIFYTLKYLYPIGRQIRYSEIEGMLVASFPLFKQLYNRGETLLGFFSIGLYQSGDKAFIYDGDAVYGAQSLYKALDHSKELFAFLQNVSQVSMTFDVCSCRNDPLRAMLTTVGVNLSLLRWSYFSNLYWFMHEMPFEKALTCGDFTRYGVRCESVGLIIYIRALGCYDQSSYKLEQQYSRRLRLIHEYWLYYPRSVRFKNVLCTPDLIICIGDDEDALIIVLTTVYSNDCEPASRFVYIGDFPYLLFEDTILSDIPELASHQIPSLLEFRLVPLVEWQFSRMAAEHGYRAVIVLNQLFFQFPELWPDGVEYNDQPAISSTFLRQLLYDNKLINPNIMRLAQGNPGSLGLLQLEMPACKEGKVFVQSFFGEHLICYYKNLRGACEADSSDQLLKAKDERRICDLFNWQTFFYKIERNYFNDSLSRYDGYPDHELIKIRKSIYQQTRPFKVQIQVALYIALILLAALGLALFIMQ